jgi:prepilin-type N-terminal cleavage/methylation domain-containing protein
VVKPITITDYPQTPPKKVKKIVIDLFCENCDLSRPYLQIPMKIDKTSSAFTLIELLVVIAIIAILASIALPVFSSVQERGKQTKDLSNGKQIALGLKQFATDHDGVFPNKAPAADYATAVPLAVGDNSNDAFWWLFPTYLTSEDIFTVAGSAWSPNPPDNKIDPVGSAARVDTLKAGECGYLYVTALNDTSNPQFPLLADAGTVADVTVYTGVQSDKGGIWKGKRAAIILVDGSGRVLTCDGAAAGPPPVTFVKRQAKAYNIFSNTEAAGEEWLTAANLRLAPE